MDFQGGKAERGHGRRKEMRNKAAKKMKRAKKRQSEVQLDQSGERGSPCRIGFPSVAG